MRVALVLALSLSLAMGATAGHPSTPATTHVVGTGRAPCGVTAAAGALWIGVYETGKLLRLDPASGRVTRRYSVGLWACRVAIAGNAAWVTRDRAGQLVRIDLRTGRAERLAVGALPFDVVLAHGSIWATSFEERTVARFDPETRTVTHVYEVGPSPVGIASCRGRVWVGHGRGSTALTSIQPRTHRFRRVEVGTTSPGWPRCIRGELWVTAPATVLRVDARTGQVLARRRLGGTPAEAAGGPDGLVWVTDKERSLVRRIHGQGARVVGTFAAGPGAYSLARVGDEVWVTSFAGSDVRSFDP